MYKIKKGDTVQVTKGRDKGKKAKVIQVFTDSNRALVEGINMVKKHKRRTRDDQKGGITSIETPISLANIMLFCKQCAKPVRVGFSILKDGTKTRSCKICKEPI